MAEKTPKLSIISNWKSSQLLNYSLYKIFSFCKKYCKTVSLVTIMQ